MPLIAPLADHATLQVQPELRNSVYFAFGLAQESVSASSEEIVWGIAQLARRYEHRPIADDFGGGLQGEIDPA